MIGPGDIFETMSPTEFMQWRHGPITAGFLRFLADQHANTRDAVADLVETGHFTTDGPAQANLHYLRGRLDVLRELQGIAVAHIQGFYREAHAASQEDRQDDRDPYAAPP